MIIVLKLSIQMDGKPPKTPGVLFLTPLSSLCCFLHVFIKIRDRCSKKYQQLYLQVDDKLWNCYRAKNKCSFSQQIRRLHEWAVAKAIPDVMLHPIEKLRNNLFDFAKAYDFPGAYRTSNMIDRLMKRMDRHLFTTCYFHGSIFLLNSIYEAGHLFTILHRQIH